METPKTGYQVQSYSVPVKRYCQTLDLRDSPELIAEYRKRHSQAEAWPEILAGIREVGILEMEIYILGTRLFMIVETQTVLRKPHYTRRCCKNLPIVLRIEKSIFSIIYYIRSLKHKKRNTSGRNYEVFLNFYVSCLISW